MDRFSWFAGFMREHNSQDKTDQYFVCLLYMLFNVDGILGSVIFPALRFSPKWVFPQCRFFPRGCVGPPL